ncbi:DUF2231 domain-containing protein [Actinophytocola algeriensis]|uniref:Putative membrane protein n=1 Tax=Actinophytocola algeriensis TaxID=1768010 RepID=A0A7W7QE61_9PSEU|nr:DUF2231 domain-containing protein [Actinophytocola algeriensis]MBB4911486.1 putative membrane protein [Actinophytocola algeriensis]MBE1473526.1 putative membrane protein [Actinophytocola algeriensis]
MDVHNLLRRFEDLRQVDGVAATIAGAVRKALRKTGANAALRGKWLGHPLHPLMVTVPIGAFVGTAVLDMSPGNRDAARKLTGLGLAAVAPTALLGLADYVDLDERQRRVGIAHATLNTMAAALFTGSYLSRARGAHTRGTVLSALGLTVLSAGGALGGHLSYAQGAGVFRWQKPDPVQQNLTTPRPAAADPVRS